MATCVIRVFHSSAHRTHTTALPRLHTPKGVGHLPSKYSFWIIYKQDGQLYFMFNQNRVFIETVLARILRSKDTETLAF